MNFKEEIRARMGPGDRIRREREQNVESFVAAIQPVFAESFSRTEIGNTEYVFDGHLAVAPDEDFKSSIQYDARRDVVTDATLRFADALTEEYSISYLRSVFEKILTDSNPPQSGLWTSYPMGDVGTGPHITMLGSGNVDADAFSSFLRRAISEYRRRFE